MTFATLPRAQQEAAVDGFLADMLAVAFFVMAAAPYGISDTTAALWGSLAFREFPPLPVLEQMVAWTCWDLERTATERPLTPHELVVHAAAWRLSHALFGAHIRHHVPRFVRSDGTSD